MSLAVEQVHIMTFIRPLLEVDDDQIVVVRDGAPVTEREGPIANSMLDRYPYAETNIVSSI